MTENLADQLVILENKKAAEERHAARAKIIELLYESLNNVGSPKLSGSEEKLKKVGVKFGDKYHECNWEETLIVLQEAIKHLEELQRRTTPVINTPDEQPDDSMAS